MRSRKSGNRNKKFLSVPNASYQKAGESIHGINDTKLLS